MVCEPVTLVSEPVSLVLVSAPVPLGRIGFLNLLGLGWGRV